VTDKSAARPGASCLGCGGDVKEYYMLHDSVWRRLVSEGDRDRELCWHCLSARLGRAPRYGDFKITPIEMICHMGLISRDGYDAWNAVFAKRINHAVFKTLVNGTTSVCEFEQRLIEYARSINITV
jgi:hypothetical protein